MISGRVTGISTNRLGVAFLVDIHRGHSTLANSTSANFDFGQLRLRSTSTCGNPPNPPDTLLRTALFRTHLPWTSLPRTSLRCTTLCLAPLCGTAHNFALFSASIFALFFSLWGSSRGILVVFLKGPSNVHGWGVGLSCETPTALGGLLFFLGLGPPPFGSSPFVFFFFLKTYIYIHIFFFCYFSKMFLRQNNIKNT